MYVCYVCLHVTRVCMLCVYERYVLMFVYVCMLCMYLGFVCVSCNVCTYIRLYDVCVM